jgi:hypothetical protein
MSSAVGLPASRRASLTLAVTALPAVQIPRTGDLSQET